MSTGPRGEPLVSRPFGGADIPALRAIVSQHAARLGLSRARGHELVLTVDEILSNAVRHGGGAGHLEVWVAAGRIWFRVTDHGSGMPSTVPGGPPAPTQAGGRGLWIAHGLADEMRISTGPDGTAVAGGFDLPSQGLSG